MFQFITDHSFNLALH